MFRTGLSKKLYILCLELLVVNVLIPVQKHINMADSGKRFFKIWNPSTPGMMNKKSIMADSLEEVIQRGE